MKGKNTRIQDDTSNLLSLRTVKLKFKRIFHTNINMESPKVKGQPLAEGNTNVMTLEMVTGDY